MPVMRKPPPPEPWRPLTKHTGEYLGGGKYSGDQPLKYQGQGFGKGPAPAAPPKPAARVTQPTQPSGGLPPFKLPSSWADLWGGIKSFGQKVFGVGAGPEIVKHEGEYLGGGKWAGPAPVPEKDYMDVWGQDEQGYYYEHPSEQGTQTRVPYIPTYYEDPARVVRMHKYMKYLMSGDTPPEGMDPKAIEAAYKYLQFRNNYAPENEWKALNENDEGRQFLQGLGLPPNNWLLDGEKFRFSRMEPEALDLQPQEDLTLEQLNLAPWQKWMIEFLSSPLAQFGMGAVPGALIGGGIGGPLGAVIGAAGMGGLSYTTNKSTTIANLLMKLDWPAEQLERALGVSLQTLASIQDPKRAGSLSELLADLPAAWKAAHLTYEVSPSWYQMLMAGPGGVKPRLGQTFPAVQHWLEGRAAPEEIPGGVPTYPGATTTTYGSMEAMVEARRRIAGGEDPASVYADMNERYGFGALTNEMIGHIFADPLNVIGDLAGPGVGLGAKLMGETDLARAMLTPKRVLFGLADQYPALMEGLATYGVMARDRKSVV